MIVRGLLALLVVLLAACQPARPPQPTAPATVAWPPYDYATGVPGARTYRLDAAASRLEVVVRREGPLARFGHDHVVLAGNPEGYLVLTENAADSRADLRFAVAGVVIDPPEARARYGLETQPDAAAVAGTRDNLLGHVLDAQAWPWIEVSASGFARASGAMSADIVYRVNGRQYGRRENLEMREEGAGVVVAGSVTLLQSDLGLQPFAALGGGLRVADAMEVHFLLRGVPVAAR